MDLSFPQSFPQATVENFPGFPQNFPHLHFSTGFGEKFSTFSTMSEFSPKVFHTCGKVCGKVV
jgi:hypothetical protein